MNPEQLPSCSIPPPLPPRKSASASESKSESNDEFAGFRRSQRRASQKRRPRANYSEDFICVSELRHLASLAQRAPPPHLDPPPYDSVENQLQNQKRSPSLISIVALPQLPHRPNRGRSFRAWLRRLISSCGCICSSTSS